MQHKSGRRLLDDEAGEVRADAAEFPVQGGGRLGELVFGADPAQLLHPPGGRGGGNGAQGLEHPLQSVGAEGDAGAVALADRLAQGGHLAGTLLLEQPGHLRQQAPVPLHDRQGLVQVKARRFLLGHCGLIEATIEGHAAYLESWLKVLRNDRTAIFTAARLAGEAHEFLLSMALPDIDELPAPGAEDEA